MKNRKIIALLCAMAMIVTTLSSIFMVSAAAQQITVDVNETETAGEYLVTVGYTGYEGRIIGSMSLQVPIPEGATFVDGSIVKKIGNVNYGKKSNQVMLSAADPAGLLDQETGKGELFSFKVTISSDVKSDVKFSIAKDGTVEDITEGNSSDKMITYIVGSETNPLSVSSAVVEYKREIRDGEPQILLSATKNENDTTITVSYDISKMTAPVIGSMSIYVPIPEGATFVDGSIVKNVGNVNYGKKSNQVMLSASDPNGLLSATTGELFSFKVTVTSDVKFDFSTVTIEEVLEG